MLSEQEWESLCNKCGKCCYIMLANGKRSPSMTCVLLDRQTNMCSCYEDRFARKADVYGGTRCCAKLNQHLLQRYYETKFLPDDCAYIKYWRTLNG